MSTFRGIGDPNTDGIRVANQDDLDAAVARAEQAVDDAEAQAGAAEASAQASEAFAVASAAEAAAAAASAVEASGYADAAEATLNDFETKYLGEKAVDPTLDNQGGALLTGALYYNSVAQNLKVYTGAIWRGSLLAVAGPVVDENIVVWDGITGTLVKDGGNLDLSDFVTGPASSGVGNTAVFADTTGKVLTDSGQPPGGLDSYVDTVLADNPDSFWLLQEASPATIALDSSGNANNGTYINVDGGGQSCLPNEPAATSADWAALGASAGRVAVPNLMSASVPTTAYAFDFWFRTTISAARMYLWDKNSTGVANRVVLLLNQTNGVNPDPGKISIIQNSSSTTNQWVSSAAAHNFYDGNEHHLAIIYNEPDIQIVLDGVDLAVTGDVGAATGVLNNDPTAIIGEHIGLPGDFKGQASHFAFWYSTSISLARAQAHYAAGTM